VIGDGVRSSAFRAMGTSVDLLVDADDAGRALGAAREEIERLEQVMSRFRPDSELSRLNRDGSIEASPDLAAVIELALEGRERTGGRFDPTVHDAVVAAGYDRTFAEVAPDGDERVDGSARCGGRIDIAGATVEVERGFRIDLGGIGKGYAAERAAELLALAGPCIVSVGGDIAVRGVPRSGGVWPVAVGNAVVLGLAHGGLATSGSDRRRWRRGGRDLHHLIDPETGAPAESDLLRVTVVAGDAIEAEVLATALFVGGASEAAAAGVRAVLVERDGTTTLAGGLA
jgi:thiamine biosynthesis lipoprotein